MATFKSVVTIKLTREDLEAALLEYLERRMYTERDELIVESLEVHSSGGHAVTVRIQAQTPPPEAEADG